MRCSLLKKLCAEDDGQDLVEYALMLVFIVLAASAVLMSAEGGIKTLLGGSINSFISAADAAS